MAPAVPRRAAALLLGLGAVRTAPGLPVETCSYAGGCLNLDVVKGLAPAPLWKHFAELSSIPRPSKQEQEVIAYIKAFADSRNLSWSQDSFGNLVVRRPGSGGGEGAEPVLLQGHVDMVCERDEGSTHDFNTDPIRLRLEGSWLQATGTTLGADNGIGAATALAVLESGPDVVLPPVEALFTVEEETGLTGADNLNGSMVTATRLLNLDSEELGAVYIGCAGAGASTLSLPGVRAPLPEGAALLELKVAGLLGGHSGVQIHEGRGNAVQMVAHLASWALAAVGGRHDSRVGLVSITGGTKDNVIPYQATAVLALPREELANIKDLVPRWESNLVAELKPLEADVQVDVREVEPAAGTLVFSASDSKRLLSALLVLPHGVVRMSQAVPGLVETSNNVASVKTHDGGLEVTTLTRSSRGSSLEAVRDRMQAVVELAGGSILRESAFPGWVAEPASQLVTLAKGKLRDRLQREPEVLAIHAGLECGLLLERCRTIKEAISFGPNIVRAHSTSEAVEVPSVEPFFQVLLEILADLAVKR